MVWLQHPCRIPSDRQASVTSSDQCPQAFPLLDTGFSCCHWSESNPEDLKRRWTLWVTSSNCEAKPLSLAGQNQHLLQSQDKHSSLRISLTIHHSLYLYSTAAGITEAFHKQANEKWHSSSRCIALHLPRLLWAEINAVAFMLIEGRTAKISLTAIWDDVVGKFMLIFLFREGISWFSCFI